MYPVFLHEKSGSKYGLLLIVAFVLSVSCSPANATDWQSFQNDAEAIKTISAQFIQTKEMKILSKPLESKGRLFYSFPNSIRWEYLSPIQTVMLAHKGKMQRYIRHGGKFVKDAGMSAESIRFVMEEINNWMAGRFDSNKNFTASILPGETKRIAVVPKSKQMKQFIEKIEISFSKTPGVIDSILIYEGEDTVTKIRFVSAVLNEPIPQSTFTSVK